MDSGRDSKDSAANHCVIKIYVADMKCAIFIKQVKQHTIQNIILFV